MIHLVHVRIEDCCRTDPYVAEDLTLLRGDACIVQTERGTELGTVVHVEAVEAPPPGLNGQRRILRKADARDLAQFEKKRTREDRAWEAGLKLIAKHKLVMKLVRVEYILDGSKVVFYYTADGRVDFRALVKDLASQLKTRIEMRQIGVRDEAKLLGGVGCCGLTLCCHTWIQKFYPVSIKVAKQQCLNLNPSRLSGVCGRLMCCLMYEKERPGHGLAPAEAAAEDNGGEVWTETPPEDNSF
jgi:cell fate regulator YaaT (PSP1 superfamily)